MDWNLCYIYKKIHHMHASQEFCFTFFTKDKSSVTNAIQRTNTPTVDIYYLELVNGIFRNYSGWEDKSLVVRLFFFHWKYLLSLKNQSQQYKKPTGQETKYTNGPTDPPKGNPMEERGRLDHHVLTFGVAGTRVHHASHHRSSASRTIPAKV